MILSSLSMVQKNFNVGDTVSIFLNENLLVKGIIYIHGQIPLGRFYNKLFNVKNYDISSDVYEDALVIIDDKNAEQLIVLTLENKEYKMFIWNDLFDLNKSFKYTKISAQDKLDIYRNEVTLTEIPYSFK